MRGPLGAVLERYPLSDGTTEDGGIIRHNRKCRDVAFLVIFIAFWVAMIVNSSFGFNQGNPLRLTYGLDYKGNVCGDKHAHPGLHQLELKYWLNPNQVYQSGVKDSQFKLSNARSICLLDCPTPLEDSLSWVCDYPEGDIHLSMDDWIDRNYDYYEILTPGMKNASLQLQGPCYPVIFPTVNVYWSCQYIARASNASLRHWKQMGGSITQPKQALANQSTYKATMANFQMKKVQQCTHGKLWNSSSEALTLTDKKVWQGSHYADFPEIIEDGDASEFTHESVTDDADIHGSVAGLVYRRRDGTKWIVAWSNPQAENSKVYTDIQRQPVHWGQIKTNLEKRGKPKFKVTKFGYNASIEIDPVSRSPTMKASFELEA